MASSKAVPPRERILKCALREFSRHGYSGGRVARITRAARVNGRMLFYYFQSKEKLFTAVLESLWNDGHRVEEAPPSPVESVIFWARLYRDNPDWTRMALWEGLERRTALFDDEADRRKFWAVSLDKMRRSLGPGGWPDFLDLRHLLLSLIAIEMAPLSLPHVARLLTGKSPSSPEFIAEREAFLQDFAYFLAERKVRPRGKAAVAETAPPRNGHRLERTRRKSPAPRSVTRLRR
jgi:AcrR family transcriptional regulator